MSELCIALARVNLFRMRGDNMRFATKEGFYSILPMPNQPCVAICYDFTIYPEFRGQRAAHKLKSHQMDQLKLLGFTSAICTTQSSNKAQIRVLMKAGWTILSNFKDQRTDERAIIWKYEF